MILPSLGCQNFYGFPKILWIPHKIIYEGGFPSQDCPCFPNFYGNPKFLWRSKTFTGVPNFCRPGMDVEACGGPAAERLGRGRPLRDSEVRRHFGVYPRTA